MFYISTGLLCGRPSIYMRRGRRKKYTILISRTTYCTSCGRSANTRRRMELLKDRKYAYKCVPARPSCRYTRHSHENERTENRIILILLWHTEWLFRSTCCVDATRWVLSPKCINVFEKQFFFSTQLISITRRLRFYYITLKNDIFISGVL